MRIALAQIVSTVDPARNLVLVRDAAGQAAAAGARLLVLPEATMCAFGVSLAPIAEPLDGPWATAVRAIAAEHDIAIVAGMFTPAPGGRVRNTLLATGRGVAASYDKIHLFDAFGFRESRTVAPGTEPVTIEVDGVPVGLTTCYDIRFPGLYRELARRGASVIVVAASWGAGPGKRAQWDLLTRARALDSTSFLLAAAQADPAAAGRPARGSAPTGVGGSVAVSPLGEVLAQLDDRPGMLVVDIDPAQVIAVRQGLPVLADRRF
ncbi:MAG: carbon-nitrogen hydrolase family protein [Nakamurella sp.]